MSSPRLTIVTVIDGLPKRYRTAIWNNRMHYAARHGHRWGGAGGGCTWGGKCAWGGHGRCGGICGGCCWGVNWCGVQVGWGHNDTVQRREVRQYKACCRIVGPVCCLRIVSCRSGRTEQGVLPAGGPFVLPMCFKPQLRQDKTRVLLVSAPSPPSRVLPRYCELQMHDRNKIPAFSKLPWILVSI